MARTFPILALLLLAAGCEPTVSRRDEVKQEMPFSGMKLRIMVVDDPQLALAVRPLEGEWNAQTGADFEIQQVSSHEVAAGSALAADAVICPCGLLGTMAQRKLLSPWPKQMVAADAGPWSEIFPLLRMHEAAWGSDLLAVPLGSPLLICYYRKDLLERLGRQPPQTWADYLELARLLANDKAAKTAAPGGRWYATAEPLAPGWAGLLLLARAAPYAKHPDNYSALFDINTMEPLVAGPPLVRALEELVEAAKLGPPEQARLDPAAVRAEFWRGHCGMALTWPTAAGESLGGVDRAIRVGFAELPGATTCYNVNTKTWETLPDGRIAQVPLLGLAGRSGVVPAASQQQQAAREFLWWLAAQHGRVLAASPATTLSRRGQLPSAQDWVEKPVPAPVAAEYAVLTQQTLGRQNCLLALPLPGRAEYLAVLDEAVGKAVAGKLSAAKALAEAAARWREITKRLGSERQRTAYLNSLGLD